MDDGPGSARRLLGVFAHPDDEVFCADGTMARAAEAGAEVMIVSATRGERGQPLVGSGADVLLGALADPDLGQVMAIGLGGRRAGLGRDVAYRLLPHTDVDARS